MSDPSREGEPREAGRFVLDRTDVSRAEWDRLLSAAGRSSLEQSWSYGEALAAVAPVSVDRAVLRDGDRPVALLQSFRRRFLGVAELIRIVRGPVIVDPEADVATVFRAVRRSYRKRQGAFALWLPELPDGPESTRLMRTLGLRRMVTGYGSAWLDLAPPTEALWAGLAGRWRTRVRTAERAGLDVCIDGGAVALRDSMAAYDRFRRGKRFSGPSGALVLAIAEAGPPGEVVHLEARAGNETVAGVVLVRHGAAATYYVGWTTPEGRARHAHNLLLWRGIEALREAGTAWLDLGGIDTETTPGIARFKLGLGATPFRLAGTFF